jgi:hypothetical protein
MPALVRGGKSALAAMESAILSNREPGASAAR